MTEALQHLPSGRSVAVRTDGGEELVVYSPQGQVEVRVLLTPDGPVVRVGAARLEIAANSVAVECETFDVRAGGEIRLKSGGALRLNGETVRLNCKTEPEAMA